MSLWWFLLTKINQFFIHPFIQSIIYYLIKRLIKSKFITYSLF